MERGFAVLLEVLPADMREGAALMVRTEEGIERWREGENRIICLGDARSESRISVGCYHESLGPFLAHGRKLSEAGLRGAAHRERLCRDVESGVVDVPSRAYNISLSGRPGGDGSLPDSVVVYHLLQLPYATEESVGISDEELSPGMPWLHHASTCDAHVMWSERRAFALP